jgi:hypothetical protein
VTEPQNAALGVVLCGGVGVWYLGKRLDRIIELLEPKPDAPGVDKATMALHRIERHVINIEAHIGAEDRTGL